MRIYFYLFLWAFGAHNWESMGGSILLKLAHNGQLDSMDDSSV